MHAIILTVATYYILYWLLAAPNLRGTVASIGTGLRAMLTWQPLTFLGANSLFVYACHVVIVALAKTTIQAIIADGANPGQLVMFAVCAAGLAVIFAATAAKRRYLPWAS